jgi:nickel transport protein
MRTCCRTWPGPRAACRAIYRTRPLPRLPLLILAAALCGVPGLVRPAAAHKMYVFATVRGEMIEGEVYYQGGDAAPDTQVAVIGPDGQTLDETVTDQEGRFRFEPRLRIDYRLAADAGFGHRAEYTVPAAELPPGLPPYVAGEPAAAPAATRGDRPAEPPRAPDSTRDGSPAEIEALTQQVVALRRDLDRWRAQLRMQDVLGGIGYILGLMGLASYLLRKKRPA